MARFREAEWLGEHSPQVDMVRYDILCIHTIVGFAPAHAAHFSVHANGKKQQSRDTRFRSAANLNGNYRIIAIENEDHGSAFGSWDTDDGHAVPRLTDAQVTANAEILAWAHETHDIPLQLCPNSKAGSRGLAYHRQGIDGNFDDYQFPGRVEGGEIWTSTRGKVCPGDRRIAQLPEILLRARIIVSGAEGGDDLQITPNSPDYQIMNLQRTLTEILQENELSFTHDGRIFETVVVDGEWGPRTEKAWAKVANSLPRIAYTDHRVRGHDWLEMRIRAIG